MSEPTFTISQYLSEADLYKGKAKYYQDRCKQLESVLLQILSGHENSVVDWDAMKRAKKLMEGYRV